MLYLRDMRSGGVRPLPTTESAIQPFFSPDSQWIGFVTDDHVKKISRQGGAAITLSSGVRGRGCQAVVGADGRRAPVPDSSSNCCGRLR